MSCLSSIGVNASNLDVEGIGLDFCRRSSSVGNTSFWHSEIQIFRSSDYRIFTNLSVSILIWLYSFGLRCVMQQITSQFGRDSSVMFIHGRSLGHCPSVSLRKDAPFTGGLESLLCCFDGSGGEVSWVQLARDKSPFCWICQSRDLADSVVLERFV